MLENKMFRQLNSLFNTDKTREKTSENPLSGASAEINDENKVSLSLKTATPVAKTLYLVDFENMGPKILDKFDNLDPETESVYFFSAQDVPNIPYGTVAKLFEIKDANPDAIGFYKVPVKSQSVDMHLVSYLGYLIGVHGATCKYIILSNDTDYDNIVKYWKGLEKVDVKRQSRPTPAKKSFETTAPKQSEKPTIKQHSSHAPEQSPKKQTGAPITSPTNTELNNAILKAIANVGYSTQTAGKVASVVCKESKKNNSFANLHSELQKTFPGESVKKLYSAIKPVIEEHRKSSTKENGSTSAEQAEPTPNVSAATTPPNEENQLATTKNSVASAVQPKPIDWNDVIQKAVISAGYGGWIPSKVASIFCKNRKDEKCLQKVHEELQSVFPNHKNLYDVVRLAAAKQFVSQENANPISLSTEQVPAPKMSAFQNQTKQTSIIPSKENITASTLFVVISDKKTALSVPLVKLERASLKYVTPKLARALRSEGYEDVVFDVDKILEDCQSKDDYLNRLRKKLHLLRPFTSLFRIVLPLVWEGSTVNQIADFYGPPRSEMKVRSLEHRVRSILSDNGFDETSITVAVELSKRYFDNTNCHWLLRNSLKQELGAKGKEAYDLLKGLF